MKRKKVNSHSEKQCYRCKKIKPLSGFYKHLTMVDGCSNKCKECAKFDSKRNKIKRSDYYKDHDRKYSRSLRRIEARKIYNKTDMCRRAYRHYASNYRKKNPIRCKARKSLAYAVVSGRIKRLPCEICGAIKTEAHHDDYQKPLNVRWLCMKHHNELHRIWKVMNKKQLAS